MTAKLPGSARFLSEGRATAEGDARRVRARDRVLGLPCVVRFAPAGSAEARRLGVEADRLVGAEHPWLTPVVARFDDVDAGSLAGHDPMGGYALFDPTEPSLADALAEASPEERVRALVGVLHVVDHLHRRGIVHGRLGADSVRWRDGAPWVVWGEVGPTWPGAPPHGPEADLFGIGCLARAVLRGWAGPARRVFDRLAPRATSPRATAADLLRDLDAIGASSPAPPDAAEGPDTGAIAYAAPHLGRPLAFVGGTPGTGLATARRTLSALASAGWHTLDLSRAASPLAALHRSLFPSERPPTFDIEWAEAVRHVLAEPHPACAVAMGDLARWSDAERALLEPLLEPLARAGVVVLFGAATGGGAACPIAMPAPDALGLAVPPSAAAVLRLLRGLPPGIPPRVLPSLPAATRAALPDLARSGHLRFDDDGAMHVSGAGTEPLDPAIAASVEDALLDPLGGTDALWRCVAWARAGRRERAGSLFADARRVAGAREDLLVEVAVALAADGHVGARLLLAELDLARGRPHRALAALATLPEGDAWRALLLGRALRLCGRADEALPGLRAAAEAHDHGALWCEYARALAASGLSSEAAAALDRAEQCPRPAAAGAVLGARAHVARTASDDAVPHAALAMVEALNRVDTAPPGLLARVALRISASGDAAHAADLLGVASARAEAIGARHLAGVLHLARAGLARGAGRDTEALAELHGALLVARLVGWRPLERAALVRLVDLALATGRLADADAPLRALAGLAPTFDDDAQAALVVARAALARGEPALALDTLDAASPAPGDALGHALVRAQALLETGRPGEARQIVEATPVPTDADAARWLLALRGRTHLALGRRLLDEARQRLPAEPGPTDRAAVGEILLAWAGEDASAPDLPERAQVLAHAATLLAGPAKARAEALSVGFAPAAAPPVASAPMQAPVRTVPAAPREVLGVVLSRDAEATGLETTVALLDPSRSNNLLLTGPTGAGKRVFAERLARERLGLDGLEEVVLRRTDPQMLVSQLVGTKRGEFTGAVDQVGAIQRAIRSRKALLLDELHTLDRVGQEILLPLLELPRRRFGGLLRSSREIDGPLHVILATNVDVSGSRWRELFRADLWFRMSQLHVHLPALSERGPEATRIYFARMLAEEGFDDPEDVLDSHATYALLAQSWEGNLRELHAAARRLARFRRQQDRRLTADDLPRLAVGAEIPSIAPFGSRDVLETLELNAVVEALRRCDWNQSAAADHLAISKYRMHRILHKHDLIDWVRDRRLVSNQQSAISNQLGPRRDR